MIEKSKEQQLEALAKITISRILVQIAGNTDISKIAEVTNKWNSEVKELLFRIYQDCQSLQHDAFQNPHR